MLFQEPIQSAPVTISRKIQSLICLITLLTVSLDCHHIIIISISATRLKSFGTADTPTDGSNVTSRARNNRRSKSKNRRHLERAKATNHLPDSNHVPLWHQIKLSDFFDSTLKFGDLVVNSASKNFLFSSLKKDVVPAEIPERLEIDERKLENLMKKTIISKISSGAEKRREVNKSKQPDRKLPGFSYWLEKPNSKSTSVRNSKYKDWKFVVGKHGFRRFAEKGLNTERPRSIQSASVTSQSTSQSPIPLQNLFTSISGSRVPGPPRSSTDADLQAWEDNLKTIRARQWAREGDKLILDEVRYCAVKRQPDFSAGVPLHRRWSDLNRGERKIYSKQTLSLEDEVKYFSPVLNSAADVHADRAARDRVMLMQRRRMRTDSIGFSSFANPTDEDLTFNQRAFGDINCIPLNEGSSNGVGTDNRRIDYLGELQQPEQRSIGHLRIWKKIILQSLQEVWKIVVENFKRSNFTSSDHRLRSRQNATPRFVDIRVLSLKNAWNLAFRGNKKMRISQTKQQEDSLVHQKAVTPGASHTANTLPPLIITQNPIFSPSTGTSASQSAQINAENSQVADRRQTLPSASTGASPDVQAGSAGNEEAEESSSIPFEPVKDRYFWLSFRSPDKTMTFKVLKEILSPENVENPLPWYAPNSWLYKIAFGTSAEQRNEVLIELAKVLTAVKCERDEVTGKYTKMTLVGKSLTEYAHSRNFKAGIFDFKYLFEFAQKDARNRKLLKILKGLKLHERNKYVVTPGLQKHDIIESSENLSFNMFLNSGDFGSSLELAQDLNEADDRIDVGKSFRKPGNEPTDKVPDDRDTGASEKQSSNIFPKDHFFSNTSKRDRIELIKLKARRYYFDDELLQERINVELNQGFGIDDSLRNKAASLGSTGGLKDGISNTHLSSDSSSSSLYYSNDVESVIDIEHFPSFYHLLFRVPASEAAFLATRDMARLAVRFLQLPCLAPVETLLWHKEEDSHKSSQSQIAQDGLILIQTPPTYTALLEKKPYIPYGDMSLLFQIVKYQQHPLVHTRLTAVKYEEEEIKLKAGVKEDKHSFRTSFLSDANSKPLKPGIAEYKSRLLDSLVNLARKKQDRKFTERLRAAPEVRDIKRSSLSELESAFELPKFTSDIWNSHGEPQWSLSISAQDWARNPIEAFLTTGVFTFEDLKFTRDKQTNKTIIDLALSGGGSLSEDEKWWSDAKAGMLVGKNGDSVRRPVLVWAKDLLQLERKINERVKFRPITSRVLPENDLSNTIANGDLHNSHSGDHDDDEGAVELGAPELSVDGDADAHESMHTPHDVDPAESDASVNFIPKISLINGFDEYRKDTCPAVSFQELLEQWRRTSETQRLKTKVDRLRRMKVSEKVLGPFHKKLAERVASNFIRPGTENLSVLNDPHDTFAAVTFSHLSGEERLKGFETESAVFKCRRRENFFLDLVSRGHAEMDRVERIWNAYLSEEAEQSSAAQVATKKGAPAADAVAKGGDSSADSSSDDASVNPSSIKIAERRSQPGSI